MTRNERNTIQSVIDYFDYHNKNTTKAQDAQIDKLRDLIDQWKAKYKALGKKPGAIAARKKYNKKYRRTHKAELRERHHEYYLKNRERILARCNEYHKKKKLELVGKAKKK